MDFFPFLWLLPLAQPDDSPLFVDLITAHLYVPWLRPPVQRFLRNELPESNPPPSVEKALKSTSPQILTPFPGLWFRLILVSPRPLSSLIRLLGCLPETDSNFQPTFRSVLRRLAALRVSPFDLVGYPLLKTLLLSSPLPKKLPVPFAENFSLKFLSCLGFLRMLRRIILYLSPYRPLLLNPPPGRSSWSFLLQCIPPTATLFSSRVIRSPLGFFCSFFSSDQEVLPFRGVFVEVKCPVSNGLVFPPFPVPPPLE